MLSLIHARRVIASTPEKGTAAGRQRQFERAGAPASPRAQTGGVPDSIAASAARSCGSMSFADETLMPRSRIRPSLMP